MCCVFFIKMNKLKKSERRSELVREKILLRNSNNKSSNTSNNEKKKKMEKLVSGTLDNFCFGFLIFFAIKYDFF